MSSSLSVSHAHGLTRTSCSPIVNHLLSRIPLPSHTNTYSHPHPQTKKAASGAGKAAASAAAMAKAPLSESATSGNKAGAGGEGRSIEQIYQKKTQLEHILIRPDTYSK